MSAESITRKGRVAAERLMVDSVRITRLTGEIVTNPDGTVTRVETVVYEGPGKLQSHNAYPTESNAADRQWTVSSPEVHLPMAGTGAVRTDDVVRVVSSLDEPSEGRLFRVRSAIRKTFQTANRLLVEEVTG